MLATVTGHPPRPDRMALFIRADDGQAMARIREAMHRRIGFTLFADAMDVRSVRLATALDAEVGSIAPQTHRGAILYPNARPETAEPVDAVVVIPGADPETWEAVHPDGQRIAALTAWDGPLLDELIAAGVRLGPVGTTPRAPLVGLEGVRAVHVTSNHRADDPRISRELTALRRAGADPQLLVLGSHHTRPGRVRAGSRLVVEAHKTRPDIVHVHDPELLPAGLLTQLTTRSDVVYDVHRDLLATARTRVWIPALIRRPFARVLRRLELLAAARVGAVVTVRHEMALEFATRGAEAVAVENRPLSGSAHTGPPRERAVAVAGPGAEGAAAVLRARLGEAALEVPVAVTDDASDVGVTRAGIVWLTQERTTGEIPALALEALADGAVVIVPVTHPLASTLRLSDAGVVCSDVDSAAQAISMMLRAPDTADAVGRRGRDVFIDQFAFEREAEKLVALYGRLTGRIH